MRYNILDNFGYIPHVELTDKETKQVNKLILLLLIFIMIIFYFIYL